VLLNADEIFPMASTFKIAVAGAVLSAVDEGRLKLTTMVELQRSRHVSSAVIAEHLIHDGVALSIYNLLEIMLTLSDNTATDYLFEVAGGAPAITKWARERGADTLSVDGDTEQIIRRFFGNDRFERLQLGALEADSDIIRDSELPNKSFDRDSRDTVSPRAMAKLLTAIFEGRALGPKSSQIMKEMMGRCRTGGKRLRALLPVDTKVADKTGTIGGTVNDVGVISLPDNAGDVIVAVFIKASNAPVAIRERAMAHIGRSIRDFYLYLDL
jgi:beta-lactamase class A